MVREVFLLRDCHWATRESSSVFLCVWSERRKIALARRDTNAESDRPRTKSTLTS